jgi:hypothetical protein
MDQTRLVREALRKMRGSGLPVSTAGGADLEQIKQAQVRLGIVFPRSYVLFLEEAGTCFFEGFDVYGISKAGLDHQAIPNVVFATETSGSLTVKGTVIGVDGWGGTTILPSADVNGEPPVVNCHSDGSEQVADGFGSYLLKHVLECIAGRGPTEPH